MRFTFCWKTLFDMKHVGSVAEWIAWWSVVRSVADHDS